MENYSRELLQRWEVSFGERAVWQPDVVLRDARVPLENELRGAESFRAARRVLTATCGGAAREREVTRSRHRASAWEIDREPVTRTRLPCRSARRDDQEWPGHPCAPLGRSVCLGRSAASPPPAGVDARPTGGGTREDQMDAIKQWTVRIDIDEHDGHTRAVARLLTRDTDRPTGVGLARLDPADRDVPEIGDEIAVARALSDLGHRMLQTATEDVERSTGTPAHLQM
jgi:hypothetical protein